MDDHPWMIIMITSVAVRIAEGGSKGGGPGTVRKLMYVRKAHAVTIELFTTPVPNPKVLLYGV